jgi:hypothetical protein
VHAAQTGWGKGDSVAIEFRSAGGQTDRLPALVAELLALKGQSDRDNRNDVGPGG